MKNDSNWFQLVWNFDQFKWRVRDRPKLEKPLIKRRHLEMNLETNMRTARLLVSAKRIPISHSLIVRDFFSHMRSDYVSKKDDWRLCDTRVANTFPDKLTSGLDTLRGRSSHTLPPSYSSTPPVCFLLDHIFSLPNLIPFSLICNSHTGKIDGSNSRHTSFQTMTPLLLATSDRAS